MSTAEQFTTADQLFRMPDDGSRYELVGGELRMMSPAGSEHGVVVGSLSVILGHYILQNHLGFITGAETGFLISKDPDTVLAPDTAFIRQDRLDQTGLPKAFFPEAPALVVEVVSPNDTVEQVDTKMRRWLNAGVELAWVVNPSGRTVTIYRALDDIQVATEQESLSGESVVPGFECKIADLFAGLN